MAGKKKKKKKVAKQKGVDLTTYIRHCQEFINAHALIICIAIITVAGLVVYSNSLRGPFIFDDFPNIVDNPRIKSISGLFNSPDHSRPVGYFSFALNYRINGLNVTGYHILNLIIHLINAVMVFFLVLLTFRTPFFQAGKNREPGLVPVSMAIALFSSLIFVTHPIETQAVSYMVQRFTSLAALFYLLAIIMYAKWRLTENDPEVVAPGPESKLGPKEKRKLLYIASLGSALLAMGTKEIAFTLPAVMFLWEFSFFSGGIKKRILNLLPFVLTIAVIPLTLLVSDERLLSAKGVTEPPPAIDYFFTQCRVIVTYLRLLFFPSGQNLDYDYPVFDTFTNRSVLSSFIFLVAIVGIGVYLYYRSSRGNGSAILRLAGFGIFWFFITLSVESSFITIPDLIFEHRLYLPSIGLIIAVVSLVAHIPSVLRKRSAAISWAVIFLSVIIIAVFSFATFNRNKVWGNSITLWEDVVSKSPAKLRPHLNLSMEYLDINQLAKARSELNVVLGMDADNAEAHNNLGVVYQRSDQLEQAKTEFDLAIGLKPDYEEAFYNLGMNYVFQKRYADAIDPFQKVIELNPGNYEAHNNLGNIYASQNRPEQALQEYQAALKIKPDYQDAKDNIKYLQSLRN